MALIAFHANSQRPEATELSERAATWLAERGHRSMSALQPDGSVRRGLALFQIKRGGPEMIEPAPETSSSPGI